MYVSEQDCNEQSDTGGDTAQRQLADELYTVHEAFHHHGRHARHVQHETQQRSGGEAQKEVVELKECPSQDPTLDVDMTSGFPNETFCSGVRVSSSVTVTVFVMLEVT